MPRGAPYRAQCRLYPIGSCAARFTDLCGASQAQSRMLKLCTPIPKAKVLLQTPTSTVRSRTRLAADSFYRCHEGGKTSDACGRATPHAAPVTRIPLRRGSSPMAHVTPTISPPEPDSLRDLDRHRRRPDHLCQSQRRFRRRVKLKL